MVEFADGKPHDAETGPPEPSPEIALPERVTREGGAPPETDATPARGKAAEAAPLKPDTRRAPGQKLSYFKRRRATSLLLILFLITAAFAFLIYPRRAAVYRPAPFSVSIYENGDISGAMIHVSDQGGQWVLTVLPAEASTGTGTGTAPAVDYAVALPLDVMPAGCQHPSCYVQENNFRSIGYSNLVSIHGHLNLTLPLTLTGPTFAWDTNGLNLEGQLPEVQVFRGQDFTGQLVSDAQVSVVYQIPAANTYDWTGGPEPAYETQGDVWNVAAGTLASPVPVGASDSSTANWDSLRTFIAGALLGIAGGALVGAVQESIHKEEKPSEALNSALRDLGSPLNSCTGGRGLTCRLACASRCGPGRRR